MNEKIVTKGVCEKCKQLISKTNAKQHINKCFNLDKENTPNAFQIKIQWPHTNSIYWLYIIVPYKFTLENLDDFLRDIWLECCSHLSQFVINNAIYSSCCEPNDFFSNEEYPMTIATKKILYLGLKFKHEYDFGSTTELLLEVVGLIKTTALNEITILMQNQEPEYKCSSCGAKATLISEYSDSVLCESCGNPDSEDDDEDSYYLPLVNSPRTGVCAYC